MSDIRLDKESKRLILSGPFGNSRESWIIRDCLIRDFSATEEGEDFVISCETDDCLENKLNEVVELFKRRSMELKRSKEVDEKFSSLIAEKKKFEVFSEKALKIRNNDCDPRDFGEFEKVVAEDMIRSLYPLQLLSAYHMAFSQNSCNFSVPGAGKTSIVYAAYTYLRTARDERRRVDRIVIIGPLSSFGPWEKEYEECFGRKPTVKRIDGNMPTKDRIRYMYSGSPAELTLISYHSLRSFEREDLRRFFTENNVMVVLDEAHRVKNPEGVHANAVLDIAPLCKSRVILTGTPAPNGYDDLYNLFKFIWPYNDVIGFDIGMLKEMSKNRNENAVITMVNNLKPYFMRIKKADLGLPDAKIHRILVEMDSVQRRIYDFVELQCIPSLESLMGLGGSLRDRLARAKTVRLMQAASNPAMLSRPLEEFITDLMDYSESDQEIIFEPEILEETEQYDTDIRELIMGYDSLETPSKFKKALEIIKDKLERGEKAVVWAMFIDTMEKFQNLLRKNGIDSRILNGSTPSSNEGDDEFTQTREEIIDEFHNPLSFKVIIANPQAVGESISLHKICHNAIYLERNFNAAQLMQSKDRIHRYGLAEGVETNYYYLISAQSVDNTIDARLKAKEDRMNGIIENEEIPLFNVLYEEDGNEDIRALLDDYYKRTKGI